MGRRAIEEDSGNDCVDGITVDRDGGAGTGNGGAIFTGNEQFEGDKATSQRKAPQAQQEHAPQSKAPHFETTFTSTVASRDRRRRPPTAVKCLQTGTCKKGSQAAPLFVVFCWVASEASPVMLRRFRERRAPHARCDQLGVCSKPGGVITLFPKLGELTIAGVRPCKRECKGKADRLKINAAGC